MLDSNSKGICIKISNCVLAINLIKQRKRPTPCGFEGVEPIVCCPEADDYASSMHGRKSREFCFKYGRPPQLMGISGGTPAAPKQFPHMALVGVTKDNSNNWFCGGSLVSLNFVLTAGHCLYHKTLGLINSVRLGEMDLSTDNDNADPYDYKIINHHGHPDYDGDLHYHDIALVQLSDSVVINLFIQPICLYTALAIPSEAEMTATGWGVKEFGGEPSSALLLAKLYIYNHDECKTQFPAHLFRKLPRGVDDQIQVCAGGRGERKDTCQGDSGGPLQIKHPDYSDDNVYGIVGVTSFGRGCGMSDHPGVYVRIYPYIQWIESIIWKED